MSVEMLHAVLRMPPACWSDDPMDQQQRHSRYLDASELIERQAVEIERLRADFADARSCAKVWKQEMQRARADERTAMYYLEQIRRTVAPDVDFPTLVQRCGEIQQERDQLKAALTRLIEKMNPADRKYARRIYREHLIDLAAHDAEVIERLIDMSDGCAMHQWRISALAYANQLRQQAKCE